MISSVMRPRYVSVIVYQGVIEDVSIFENLTEAISWIIGLRRMYSWEDTSESLVWDTLHQLPIEGEVNVKEGV